MERMTVEAAVEIMGTEIRKNQLLERYAERERKYDWLFLLAKASGVIEQAESAKVNQNGNQSQP